MGSFICHGLQDRGIPFVVIDNNPEVQERVLEVGYLLSPGDATEEEVLQAAGIERASSLVSVLESDAQNVYAVLSARELNPEIAIIARAGEESARKKLIRAGANRVINPYQIGGMRMLMGLLKPTVVSFLEVVMDHRDMNIELEEIIIEDGSQYIDKKLIETEIRRVLNLIVIAVKKPDGSMVFNPGPETIVNSRDTLIVMGKRDSLALMEKNAHSV
jgi:voltage-gated potassium channel